MEMSIPNALAFAQQHLHGGRLSEAETLCRRILDESPRNHQAYRFLGIISFHSGNRAAAVEYLQQAITLNPDIPNYHTLSAILASFERFEEAEQASRKVLEIDPRNAEAQNNLGNVLKEQGRLEESIEAYQQALAIEPNFAEAHSNLGNALQIQGRSEESAQACRRALAIRPDFAIAENNLANALFSLGKLEEAEQACRRALRIQPRYAQAENNLGNILEVLGRLRETVEAYRRLLTIEPNNVEAKKDLARAEYNFAIELQTEGRLKEAEETYRRALALKPNYPEAENNLGNTLKDLGLLEEAVEAYRRALVLRPNYGEAEYNLGTVLFAQNRLDESVQAFGRAIEIQPEYPEAENNLAAALKAQGRIPEAIQAYRRSLAIRNNAQLHSNLLLCLNYEESIDPALLLREHLNWDQIHGCTEILHPHDNDPSPERRLRIGYVSPDFRTHAVAFFVEPILAHHDSDNVETFCYSECLVSDTTTESLESKADNWRSTQGLTDYELARMIREDAIDILIDLAGHTANNRLGVFALKPAPVQATWIGYVGTTGLKAMDYLIADRYLVPPKSARYYREKVLRLPDGYSCYIPRDDSPEVGPLPALANGQVTFGSFNNLAKFNPKVVEVWAKILKRVPKSRLMLKYRGLGDTSTRNRFVEQFTAHGVDPARLELLGYTPFARMMEQYNQIDLALDPFPFTGGATTCLALWMGVPVITCPGETFASRMSLSHSSNLGLTETIAKDFDEYVEIAVNLAQDLPRLTNLRAGLRQRMANSPLCDGKRFAENLMKALSGVWREWCETANENEVIGNQ